MAFEFYQNHLNRVSRSFAACISRLESPMRGWVSLTYLICRILDTVEDAKWAAEPKQAMSYREFDEFLRSPEALTKVQDWAKQFPDDIAEGEKLLIQDANKIFQDLHHSPSEIRGIIQELVGSMSRGMAHFSKRKKNGKLRLEGLREVNQYCFFVAGIVGETLSKLLASQGMNQKLSRNLLVDAHHFGLFLQKVNLLKDQFDDEKEGRFLIPSREVVFQSLRRDADGAMRYVESIPLEQKGYRVFCLWSLFLGLRTLPLLAGQESPDSLSKITREETLALFEKIEAVASDAAFLRAMYDQLMEQVGLPSVSPAQKLALDQVTLQEPVSERFQHTMDNYQGALVLEDFKRLGLV